MSTTNYLGLNIPDKNSKGRVVTDVFEPNFTKIDQNAEVVDIDKNAIWGGEYGGYIQDTSITKVVGKRYIDQFDKKAYECLVPSHENTITNYQACNVKDNLSKLNNLIKIYMVGNILVEKYSNGIIKYSGLDSGGQQIRRFIFPERISNLISVELTPTCRSDITNALWTPAIDYNQRTSEYVDIVPKYLYNDSFLYFNEPCYIVITAQI